MPKRWARAGGLAQRAVARVGRSSRGGGRQVVYTLRVDGAPNVVLPPLAFTTFTEAAGLGPLHSFTLGNFKGGGESSDRNLFVMDNLHLRLPFVPAVPEPASTTLLAVGPGLLVGWRKGLHK